MNSAIIVMTILGCSHGEAACEYMRTVETTFADRAQCYAQSDRELMKSDVTDYPVVIAVCEPLPVMTAGLPAAEADDANAVAEPKIIYSQFDKTERPHPLRWTVDTARKLVTGTKLVIVKGWHRLTGKKDDEPILLGRYAEMDL